MRNIRKKLAIVVASQLLLLSLFTMAVPASASAARAYYCGDKTNKEIRVRTSFNIGCQGKGNPIADGLFAIIRVLSDGVGLVIVGSMIVGGIQYSASKGDPQATAMAVNRIRSTLIALLIYIFGYAILNYIIPYGFLG